MAYGFCIILFYSLKSINGLFITAPMLYNKLSEIRNENMRHSQYVTARENLKHIFTVPESVQKTKQWISEGKLLHSHQVSKMVSLCCITMS